MDATTINSFPPVHTFDSPRSWFLALIALIHLGFFWALSNGLSLSTWVIKPVPGKIIVIDDPLPPPPAPDRTVDIDRVPMTWTTHIPPVPVPNPPIEIERPELVRETQPTHPPRGGDTSPPAPTIVQPTIPRAGLSEPIYPASSIRQGHTGTVLLSVQVLANGRVGEIRLLQSSGHPKLDESAIREARTWRFVPGTQDGRPVSLWKGVPITFELRDRNR